MHPARRVAARVVIAIVILAMTAACTTTQGSDKTGGDTVVLTLATFEPKPNANGQNHGPEAFVQNLGKVSQGRLKVELKTEYGDGAADAESKIVRDRLARSTAGGPRRERSPERGPWARSGRGPHDDRQLRGREGPGLGAGGRQVARPAGRQRRGRARPPAHCGGRSPPTNPCSDPRTGSALPSGVQLPPSRPTPPWATPADLSFSFIDQIKEGSLRGAEFDIAQYEQTGAGPEAGNVTANVVLWPKVFVLALSQKRLDALTSSSRTGCARRPPRPSRHRGRRPLRRGHGCADPLRQGARPGRHPRPAPGLRTRLRPVLDKLAADPTNAALLGDLQDRHTIPGPEAPEVPANCAQGVADTGSPGQVPAATSALPDGVYRHQLTHDQVAAAGGPWQWPRGDLDTPGPRRDLPGELPPGGRCRGELRRPGIDTT